MRSMNLDLQLRSCLPKVTYYVCSQEYGVEPRTLGTVPGKTVHSCSVDMDNGKASRLKPVTSRIRWREVFLLS